MLKFITGAAGTGKSTRLREEITALAEKEKRVLCLVPEQYSFETERVLYPTGAEVYSMERLADAVFRSCGGLAGEYAGETFQLLLMRQLLADLKGTLTAFEKTAGRPDFAAGMLRTLTELKRAGLTPPDLLEAAQALHSGGNAPGGLLELKLNDLALIMEGYNAELSRSYLDPTERLTRAAKKNPRTRLFCRDERLCRRVQELYRSADGDIVACDCTGGRCDGIPLHRPGAHRQRYL